MTNTPTLMVIDIYKAVVESERLEAEAEAAGRVVQQSFRDIEQHDLLVREVRVSNSTMNLLLMTPLLFDIDDVVRDYPSHPKYLYTADIVIDNDVPHGEVVANAERSICQC